jgi:RNA polymerase sigma factor (sigma-70 family)
MEIMNTVSKYRIDSVCKLARQMGFTPSEARWAQVAAAEQLLHDIHPEKAYPLDFVVFRITGYRPKTEKNSDLLTGIALQHDLGLLVEQISESLNLHAADLPEPVLSIDDVAETFNITAKTVQRWRRRGLPARRLIFPDGKQRVGFLLSSVEHFFAAHEDQLTNCSPLRESEQIEILRRARRLATECGCWRDEIARRIGRKMGRSPLAVVHTLRKHDAENPKQAILPLATAAPTDRQQRRILRGFARGLTLQRLAKRAGRSRSAVWRVILEQRIAKLNKRKIRFIDDPLYHGADAERTINEIVSQPQISGSERAEDSRRPRDLPPYLAELYRVPLLSAGRERALFLKFNFHKWQFATARRRLEPQFAKSADLDVLEGHLRQVVETKNQILSANLRLVVSVARKHVRPGLSLMELISEGNITLMRAVEGFDIHKGHRFSTYATLALMKGFARSVPMMLAAQHSSADTTSMATMPDPRQQLAADRRIDRDHVEQLLSHLDERERRVLLVHYGLENEQSAPATYEQISRRLGLSQQRVRRIEQTALNKLRAAAPAVHPQ